MNEQNYITYVNALCNWNRVDDILDLITDAFEEGFKSGTITVSKERRKSSRGVRFKEMKTINPIVAIKVLHHILEHPLNRLAALPKNRDQLIKLANSMSTVKVSYSSSCYR